MALDNNSQQIAAVFEFLLSNGYFPEIVDAMNLAAATMAQELVARGLGGYPNGMIIAEYVAKDWTAKLFAAQAALTG